MKTRNATFAALLVVCVVGCGQSTTEKNKGSVLSVLRQDKLLGNRFKNFPSNAAPLQIAEHIGNYCVQAELIDVSTCPADFAVAYRQHIQAWRETQAAVAEFPESFIEGLFMGAGNFALRGESDGGRRRIELGRMKAMEHVRSTWAEVEKAGARYGAAI